MGRKLVLLVAIQIVSITSFAAEKHAGTSCGRYQIIQISDMRRDQFLIDTETGALWNAVCHSSKNGECVQLHFQRVPVDGLSDFAAPTFNPDVYLKPKQGS